MSIGQKKFYRDIPNDDLDVFIRRIDDSPPKSGERMVIAWFVQGTKN